MKQKHNKTALLITTLTLTLLLIIALTCISYAYIQRNPNNTQTPETNTQTVQKLLTVNLKGTPTVTDPKTKIEGRNYTTATQTWCQLTNPTNSNWRTVTSGTCENMFVNPTGTTLTYDTTNNTLPTIITNIISESYTTTTWTNATSGQPWPTNPNAIITTNEKTTNNTPYYTEIDINHNNEHGCIILKQTQTQKLFIGDWIATLTTCQEWNKLRQEASNEE